MARLIQGLLEVDESDLATVIVCHECHSWRECRPTRAAALVSGARHLKSVHGDTQAARRVAYLAARRSR